MKQVQVTTKVNVDTVETLVIWLNRKIEQATPHSPRDAGKSKGLVGALAINLIHEAGFFLTMVDPNKKKEES